MARVPVSNGSVAAVAAPAPYQRSIATVEDFGGAAARGMIEGGQKIAGLGDALGKRVMAQQVEDNEREAKALDVEFAKQVREIGYGDGNEKQGFYSARGEDAVKGRETAESALDEARRKVLEGAKNDRVRAMFGDISAKRVETEKGQFARHYETQRRAAGDATSEARIAEAADDAGAAWNNPQVTARSIGIVRGEVQDMGARNGWSPEVINSKMQEAQTVLHRKIIDSALVQDPAAAKAYYDANKDKIDGRVRADIEKGLEAGTLRQQSQAAEDRIMGMGLSESQALAQARAIKDPKLRDETVQRVTQRFAETSRIEARQDKANRQEAWDVIKNGGSTDNLTPQQLASLDGTTISSMREFQNRRAKDGRGFAAANDPNVDLQIHNLFMENKAAFVDLDMSDAMLGLTEERWNYWTAQQRSLDKNDEKAKAKAPTYALANGIAKQFMDSAKWDYGEKGKDSAKAQRVYEAARGVVDRMSDEGKRASQEDITKAMKELFLRGESNSTWSFGDGKPMAAFLGTDKAGKFNLTNIAEQKQQISEVTGVPAEHIEGVADALRKKKLPVTAANIQSLYQEATRGK